MKLFLLLLFIVLNCFYLTAQESNALQKENKKKFISEMENEICGYEFAEDGILDENGNFVYIKNYQPQSGRIRGLNCSGFTKLAADYIYKKLRADENGIIIEKLKNRYTELRKDTTAEAYEYSHDPFFAQDWIRNIAHIINNTTDKKGDFWDIGEIKGFKFDERWGFQAEDIEKIGLYLDQKYPYSVFFFAVAKVLDKETGIKQFAHSGMIAFDRQNDKLKISFFESNIVNTLPRFLYNNSGRYIWLVRVDISDLLIQENDGKDGNNAE